MKSQYVVLAAGLAWLGAGWAPTTLSADELAKFFRNEPPGSLARRLQETADAIGASSLAGKENDENASGRCSIQLNRRYRWIPELHCAVVETTPVSNGLRSGRAGQGCLVDWLFRGSDRSEDMGRYQALRYRNDIWYGSTYWTGPNWTRVGKDWHHPGKDTPSVRRFTVPRDGHITVTGRVYKADTHNGGGDGVRLMVRHNRQPVWHAEIDGDDAKGVEPRIQLDVRKGDAIRFIVHKRGAITCDTTHWDPIIRFDDGQTFRASASFSKRQGNDGWSYEMEGGQPGESGWPTVHGLSYELLAWQHVLAPDRQGPNGGAQVVEGLPIWVVADRHDASGVVVAVASTDAWRCEGTCSDDGTVRIRIHPGGTAMSGPLKPGQQVHLPPVIVAAYRGNWLNGVRRMHELLSDDKGLAIASPIAQAISQVALQVRATTSDHEMPDLSLCAMVAEDWKRQDKLDGQSAGYIRAAKSQLTQTEMLLADLTAESPGLLFASEMAELAQLKRQTLLANKDLKRCRLLYARVHWLKRRIALKNPLMQFGPMLFCKRVPTSYSHLVMQYYGWRARPGGGLFVLGKPGYSLACHDILAGKLNHGNVLEPRLSYDGKRIVFSFVRCPDGPLDANAVSNDTDEGFYHVWTVNTDGSQLRQLTRGPFDDLMPTWLPDGGIAFSSTRRKGYARCFGGQFSRRWHVYTIHRVEADGSRLRILSVHDTNEWFPTVSHSGHILYSRWDYIDRDAVTHQNLWAMRPDGTNPVAVWGNATSKPHCTFQAQPIPGSDKVVFTASAHHSITAGTIAILDPALGADGLESIARVTPEIPFPEAESRAIREYYAAPWPLSEKYFLVAYSPWSLVWEPGANRPNALGIYLIDTFGNRELIYRDPAIGSTNPCPLVVRPRPPVLTSELSADGRSEGEMVLLNVYEGLGNIAPGTIKQLRIIQILPKTTNVANTPPVGIAREENARVVLGTVPVYPDGSARFLVPALKPILFQALDKDGFAYQTMRTVTYVQPGERISCYGCHENRRTAPGHRVAVALHEPASRIEPGPFDGRPFSYMQLVQPVLDKHCVKCHSPARREGKMDLTGTPYKGFSTSYWSLCGDRDFWASGTNAKNAAEAWVPRFGGRNQIQVTPPGGLYGARGSRLLKMLRSGHEGVKLNASELSRLATWIDCNAVFYGVYEPKDQVRQLRGESVALPAIQ